MPDVNSGRIRRLSARGRRGTPGVSRPSAGDDALHAHRATALKLQVARAEFRARGPSSDPNSGMRRISTRLLEAAGAGPATRNSGNSPLIPHRRLRTLAARCFANPTFVRSGQPSAHPVREGRRRDWPPELIREHLVAIRGQIDPPSVQTRECSIPATTS